MPICVALGIETNKSKFKNLERFHQQNADETSFL
jgi:hypothetical protein